ncbi:hypothetical protein [Aurantibacter sp.]|uniref:hypothetical protein n=1 Tax=Aurantibacter sp. TaxID=2807103 RepID=UPI0032645BDD
MIHLAAQYLAAAGISFLDEKDDDSHTNLGFDTKNGFLETWPLNEKGGKLALDYQLFSLHWINKQTIETTLNLDGKTHDEIIKWITEITKNLSPNKSYKYNLHYELPYEKITDGFIFSKPQVNELNKMLSYRTIAQHVLEDVVDKMKMKTTFRIWPHHFDTGGYESFNSDNNISVGCGMAIPDNMINDFYLYTAGYKGHDGIDISKFEPLTIGNWMNEGFKGAVLNMKDVDETKAKNFFNESIEKYSVL